MEILKKIAAIIRKNGGPALLIILAVSTWAFLGSAIEYYLPLSSYHRFAGQISSVKARRYSCMGYRRFHPYGKCESTDIRLAGIPAHFHLATRAGRGGYIDGIQKGDFVVIYRRHWYQYPLTFGSLSDIYRLEKNGEIFYGYSQRRVENFARLVITGAISIVFTILFFLERQTRRLLREGKL